MNVEIQNLQVYYKNEKLIIGKDFEIENYELIFKRMINKRYLKIFWKTIK